jgi:predicted kinase
MGQGLDRTVHVASLGDIMNLVILCGLQASGKSTYRERTFDGTHAVVSKDLMSRGSKRSKSMRQELQIREWFESGNSVVVDNTNPAFEDRAALIALGREYSARVVCYHFKSTWDQSLDRNALRTGRARVPYVAIAATSKRWVTPTLPDSSGELYEVVWGPGRTFLEARVG